MALTRTGTEFVVKGFSQFINSLKAINREYKSIADNQAKMAASVAAAGERFVRAQQRQSSANEKLKTATKNLTLVQRQYEDSMVGIRVLHAAGFDVTEHLLKVTIKLERAWQQLTSAQNENRNAGVDANKASQQLTDAIAAMTAASAEGTSAVQILKAGLGALTGTLGVVITVIGAYIAIVAVAVKATISLVNAIIKVASFIGSALVKGITIAINVLKSLIDILARLGRTAFNIALAPLQALGTYISRTLSVTMGVLLRDSIRAVVDAFGRLKDAVIGIIADFQTLEIRLQNLIARELRLTGVIDDVADSFDAAAEPATKLSEWIRTISTQVPFDISVIGNTTAFAMAMGFTEEQAKSLTLSIANFAAGMGLTSDKMESIIFNFGQMKAAGKVTGTEMRDLARGAFLPLTDVLDEAAKLMGVNTENIIEFRKQAAAGEVPIEAFFQAFQNVVARDFPDAVERMGKTLQGVATRFKNFLKTIVGVEILGPIMKRVAEAGSNFLDNLMTPAVLRTARAIGRALQIAWDFLQFSIVPLKIELGKLADALGLSAGSAEGWVRVVAYIAAVLRWVIQRITEFIKKLRQNTDESLGDMVKRWAQYGANMVIALAKGMAAAFSAVVTVLIKLGRLIASFLEAHSPPKLLPYLDKWGAEAMTSYMKGWLNADFSVFNDIADKVESYVRSLTENILPEKNVVPMILKLRDSIAKAISGKISIGDIFAGFKNATPELKGYVGALVKVGQATKELEKAQQKLNEITEKYDKILDPLYKQLDRLTDSTQDFDDSRRKSLLELIKTDVNASEGDKRRAQLEIDRLNLEKEIRGVENEREDAVKVAEDAVDVAQKNLDVLQAELDAKEALVDVQIKTNELIKEQLALLESLKSAGGGAEPITTEDLGLGDLGIEIPSEEDLGLDDIDFAGIFAEAQKAIDEFFNVTLPGMFASIGEEFAPLNEQLEELKTTWGGVWDSLSGKFTEFSTTVEENGGGVSGILTTIKEKLEEVFGPFLQTIEPGVAALAISTGLLADSIRDLGSALGIGAESETDFGDETQVTLGKVFNFLAGIIAFGTTIIAIWVGTFANIAEDLRQWWEETKGIFTEQGITTQGIWDWIWRTAWFIVGGWKGLILGILGNLWDSIVEIFQGLYDDLVGESIWPDMLSEMTTALTDWITENLEDWQEWIDGIIAKLVQFALDIYTQGVAVVKGLLDGLQFWWDNYLVPWVETNFGWLLNILRELGIISSPSKVMYEQGKMLMLGLANGIRDFAKLPVEEMMKMGDMVIEAGLVPVGNTTNVNNNNYTLNMPTTASPASVERAFGVMRLMNT